MHHINLLYCVSTALWDLLSATPQLATRIELNPENAENEKQMGRRDKKRKQWNYYL